VGLKQLITVIEMPCSTNSAYSEDFVKNGSLMNRRGRGTVWRCQ